LSRGPTCAAFAKIARAWSSFEATASTRGSLFAPCSPALSGGKPIWGAIYEEYRLIFFNGQLSQFQLFYAGGALEDFTPYLGCRTYRLSFLQRRSCRHGGGPRSALELGDGGVSVCLRIFAASSSIETCSRLGSGVTPYHAHRPGPTKHQRKHHEGQFNGVGRGAQGGASYGRWR